MGQKYQLSFVQIYTSQLCNMNIGPCLVSKLAVHPCPTVSLNIPLSGRDANRLHTEGQAKHVFEGKGEI